MSVEKCTAIPPESEMVICSLNILMIKFKVSTEFKYKHLTMSLQRNKQEYFAEN